MNRGLATALVLVSATSFPLPYPFRNWWRYVPVTILLLLTFRVVYGDAWRIRAGLSHDRALALGLFVVVTAVACLAVPKLTNALGLVPMPETRYVGRPIFSIFHALNEELVFRALPLLAIPAARRHPRWASALAAIGFALAHAVFYPLVLGGPIGVLPLCSLFFLALGLNGWCVTRQSIGVPWAIHAGVNTALFGLHDFADGSGAVVKHAQFFEMVVGHPAVLAATVGLAISGLFGRAHPASVQDR